MKANRRILLGALLGVVGVAALGGAMFPLRAHLSVATAALVLVVPVVAGVSAGGFAAGAVTVLAGFAVYDFVFIPPYYTFAVGASQNWVALAVYVLVMITVSRVVATLQLTRAEARRRERDTRRLFELSDLLIGDKSLSELLALIVSTVHDAFGLSSVALLLPGIDGLEAAAAAGDELSAADIAAVTPSGGTLRSLAVVTTPTGRSVGLPITATGSPVGVLVLSGPVLPEHDWELLRTYTNQAALAIERARLREQALKSGLLEEVDRWRQALLGAVSHDLRTPLASVKAAVSTLREHDLVLDEQDRDELLELIESQSDRLARLVTNLLDMTRIQAGALVVRPRETSVAELADEALASLDASSWANPVVLDLPPALPLVQVDHVLIGQVLVNLLENAARHSPDGAAIVLGAKAAGEVVEVSVSDAGPGVPPAERERIFQMFNKVSGGGRAGLGLAIATAFLEAHGQPIRVDDAPGGGARFSFTLPVSLVASEVP